MDTKVYDFKVGDRVKVRSEARDMYVHFVGSKCNVVSFPVDMEDCVGEIGTITSVRQCLDYKFPIVLVDWDNNGPQSPCARWSWSSYMLVPCTGTSRRKRITNRSIKL